jgi:cytochrome P450
VSKQINPPEVPGALPVIGHAVPLLRSPLDFLRSLPAHGDVVQVRLGTRRMLIVCDPELTRTVLVQDRLFDKGGPLFDQAREIIGNGIVACPHHDHRRQRRLMQPAFHRTRMPGYARAMSGCIATVTGAWRDGQILDVARDMQKFTTGVLTSVLFGTSISDATFAELEQDITTIVRGTYLRMLLPRAILSLPTVGNLRFIHARQRLRRILADAIAGRRTAHAEARDDLLSLLLAARDAEGDGQGMSETELIDQVATLYIAGSETSATALTWALQRASAQPEVQRHLAAEAGAVLSGTTAAWDDLPHLRYTRNVINETLRLYPPLWLSTRTTTASTVLGDYTIPRDTTVAYSPYIIGRLPTAYDEPDRFDPDRWSADAGPLPPRNAFVPFAGGARKCMGDEFGQTEAVLMLASIMARWTVSAQPGNGHRPKLAVTLRPRGLRLKLTAHAATPGGSPPSPAAPSPAATGARHR